MQTESNLDFDAFFAEVGAVYIGYFSNQTESDIIYRLFSASSLSPPTFHLSHCII